MKPKTAFIVLILLFLPAFLQAQPEQQPDTNDPYEHRSYAMYGINYLSDNVYLGRKDSNVIQYYSPFVGYHHRTGIFGKVSASYNPNAGKRGRLDLLTIEAGYEHGFGAHFYGGASVNRYVYSKDTRSVRGSTKWNTGVYGMYVNDWIEPMVSLDVNVARKTDIVAGLHADHNFSFLQHKNLEVTPTLSFYAGTQHYYDEYFVNLQNKKDKSLQISKALASASRFKALDIELSVNMAWRTGRWLLTAKPVYVLPLNAATVILPLGTFTEHLKNSFFIELEVCRR